MSRTKSAARQCALQALYQWQMTGDNIQNIRQQFEQAEFDKPFHKAYFQSLLEGVVNELGAIDDAISPFTSRELEKVDPIEKAILRLGTFELLYKIEVPYRVVLNEAIDLSKSFGSDKSHAYINSILDQVAQQCRQIEISANKKKKSSS